MARYNTLASPIKVLAYLQHARNEVRPLVERYEDITRPCGAGPIRVEHVCHKPNPALDGLYDGKFRMEAGRLVPA